MDRTFDPVYAQARSTLEALLDASSYQLVHEYHGRFNFGSAAAEYRGPDRRVKVVWDGKERFLILLGARVSGDAVPAHAWEPLMSTDSPTGLKTGPVADAWIESLSDRLRGFIDAA